MPRRSLSLNLSSSRTHVGHLSWTSVALKRSEKNTVSNLLLYSGSKRNLLPHVTRPQASDGMFAALSSACGPRVVDDVFRRPGACEIPDSSPTPVNPTVEVKPSHGVAFQASLVYRLLQNDLCGVVGRQALLEVWLGFPACPSGVRNGILHFLNARCAYPNSPYFRALVFVGVRVVFHHPDVTLRAAYEGGLGLVVPVAVVVEIVTDLSTTTPTVTTSPSPHSYTPHTALSG